MAGVVRSGRRERRTTRAPPPTGQPAPREEPSAPDPRQTGAMSEETSDKPGTSSSSGIGLTFPQIIASALAAATAAIMGSFLGVLGTIGGAAVASIVSTVGSALYQRSLEATRDRVKQRLVVAGTGHTKVASAVGRVTGQAGQGAGRAVPAQGQQGARPGAPTQVHPTQRVAGPPTAGPGVPPPPQQVRPGMPPVDPTRRVPGAAGPPTGRPAPGRVALQADGLADPTRVHPPMGAPTGARPTTFIPQSRQTGTPPGGGPAQAGPTQVMGQGGPGGPFGPGGPGGPGNVTQVAPLEPEPAGRRFSAAALLTALRGLGWKTWVTLGGVAASVFVIALLATVGVETATGGPLSGGSSGTSVGSIFGQETGTSEATTAPSDSATDESSTDATTEQDTQQQDQTQDGDTATTQPESTTQAPRTSQGGVLPNLVPRSGGSGGGPTNG